MSPPTQEVAPAEAKATTKNTPTTTLPTTDRTTGGMTPGVLPTGLVRDLARVPGWAQDAATTASLSRKAQLLASIETAVVDVMRYVATTEAES